MAIQLFWETTSTCVINSTDLSLTTTEHANVVSDPEVTSQSEWPPTGASRIPTSTTRDRTIGLICASFLWIIVCLALVGNSLVLIFGFSKSGRKQNTQKIFVCSLAVADLIFTLGVTWTVALTAVNLEWSHGVALCKISTYLQATIIEACNGTMTAIAIDRFFAVTRPNKSLSNRTACLMLTYVWFHCLVSNSPWLVYSTLKPIGGDRFRCSFDMTPDVALKFTMSTRMLNYFLPLVVTWFAYIAILYKMWISKNKVAQFMSQSAGQRAMTRKVTLLSLIILTTYTVTWTPLQLNLVMVSLGRYEAIPNITPLFVLGAANSCLNPFIYGFVWSSFRRAIRRIFICLPAGSSTITSHTGATSVEDQL